MEKKVKTPQHVENHSLVCGERVKAEEQHSSASNGSSRSSASVRQDPAGTTAGARASHSSLRDSIKSTSDCKEEVCSVTDGSRRFDSWRENLLGVIPRAGTDRKSVVAREPQANSRVSLGRSRGPAMNFLVKQVYHEPSAVSPTEQSSSNAEDLDGTEKVRARFLGMWNNMKYNVTAKLRTNFSKNSPVWLLGELYEQYEKDENQDEDGKRAWFEAFKRDFYTRIWLTYRREFPVLTDTSFTSDCGWGCMLRSGQMMLAQGLVHHLLGREWRWSERGPNDSNLERKHRQIIRWFGDQLSRANPFSLHWLVSMGEKSGKKAGDWYGPGSVAHLLSQAMTKASDDHPLLADVCIYVASDCTVYKQDVLDLCERKEYALTSDINKPKSPTRRHLIRDGDIIEHQEGLHRWKSVILLIPTRLGTDKLNPTYIASLMSFLTLKNCIGIIGGRPRHSLYFIGFQEDKLIHLDPHYCQEMVGMDRPDFMLSSFHCKSPRKLDISKMDPSCCIGFYCKTMRDLEDLMEAAKEMKDDYPIFIFKEGCNSDDIAPFLSLGMDEGISILTANDNYESEEFILL